MTYKKIKKRQQSQKSKTTHLISPELIKGKQFKEIGSRLQDVAELSDRDRYVYGYSLFHTGRFIDQQLSVSKSGLIKSVFQNA